MMENKRLQGLVIDIEKTDEYITDEEGNRWVKCIFTVELTNYSKPANEPIPEEIRGKKVKLVRYCCFDWHYKIGVRKTLELDESEAVLTGRPSKTVFW